MRKHAGIHLSQPDLWKGQSGTQKEKAKQKIQSDLRRCQRNADGVKDDQHRKQPIGNALETVRDENQSGDEKPVKQTQRKDQPLKKSRRKSFPENEKRSDGDVAAGVNEKISP